jgi:Repeat of unknown function (DUF5650)
MKTTAFTSWLLIFAACLFFSGNAAASTQTDIIGPAGSEQFGTTVTVLPNGNFVVTDPYYDAPGPVTDVGRVYLYDGNTLALINSMTGTAANDGVGSNGTGHPVTVLPNGDYIVCSSGWNGQRGAVTRCSPTTGCPSAINSSNSLVGSVAGDFVGQDGIVVLPNGNFVVRSSQWNNGATTQAGALTWFAAAATPTGAVTTANSRYGGHSGDQVGLLGVIVLSNSNYVTQDAFWDSNTATDVGASTFCSGTAACTGVVSSANSLVGTTNGDFFFIVITPLTNGNYVVNNGSWDNGNTVDVGAATFCDGTTGCHAVVGPGNSLIGTTGTVGSNQGDLVGLNGSIALTNGNYVVESTGWNRPGAAAAGAATFCNGTTGCVNMTVSTGNSLVGVSTNDNVGRGTALTNGNYVINTSTWDNPAGTPLTTDWGASTFCSGTSGCTGDVTTANSLTGHRFGDGVGGSAVALTNGNYVVTSQRWTNDNGFILAAGATTWCNGTMGCSGLVTDANSLIGAHANDQVGNVIALTNGNYVVSSLFWDNGNINDAGAATFCSGTSPCVGTVSPLNSLVGTKASDQVGRSIYPLANGNYVAQSSSWDSGASQAGAATFCSGTAGRVGAVTSSNSLVGSHMTDGVGGFFPGGVYPIANNSDYIVFSPMWTNGATPQAGAVTYGLGNGGTVGPVTVANSVRGMMNGGGGSMNFSVGGASNTLVVGRPPENIVTVFKQGGISFSVVSRKTHGGTPFDINLPPAGSPGVECRSGGASNDFRIVFSFPGTVTFDSASVSSGVGSVSSSSGGGTATVTVDVTGVTNAQVITVTLTNVHSGSVNADVSVPMGVLFGDTNGSGTVSSTDVSQTKLRSGQAVDGTNFRSDVNLTNSINGTDVSAVKLRVGTGLPSQPAASTDGKPASATALRRLK